MIHENKTKTYSIIPFKQPAGEFAMLSMSIYDLIKISYFDRRSDNPETGIQRKINPSRVTAIARFVDNKNDLTVFPTPIILSLPYYTDDVSDHISDEENPTLQTFYSLDMVSDKFTINNFETPFAKVIDGQHRLLGIKQSNAYKSKDLELTVPVLFVVGADIWTQAYLFAKINGEQRQVPYSFVADLFGLSPNRDVATISHKTIRALNDNNNSALKGCIKMLGIRIDSDQTLSQGTIAREFQKLLDSRGVLHKYYQHEADTDIIKIMLNYFNAIKNVWPSDWADTNSSIIRKTVGFLGFIKAFPDIFKMGLDQGNLQEYYFESIFKDVRTYFDDKRFSLTNERYGSNAANASKLKNDILEGVRYKKK